MTTPPEGWRLPSVTAPEGWLRVDCHLHTAFSGDAVTTIAELGTRAVAEGIDVLCVTDHHTLDGAYVAHQEMAGVRIIIGEEIRTHAGEIIGLFLTERVPYVLPLADAVRRVKDQGGIVYAPHPFDPNRRGLGRSGMDELCAAGALDVVEVCNAKVVDEQDNQRAMHYAAARELAMAAGSDAHDQAGIGGAYLLMPDFDGPADFLRKLADARITGEYRPHDPLAR
ncbi:hypothetical protein EV191_11393 [Tamaricihabitans halophyticus]|uniref:Polymerase/histidinol phosphatase N-terminal domain-containing protein n=1 Tax=Tamaricihabitans halophyticus TaxID=1262583 RepID=A0A4V2SSF8_9PSEU|nr:PHP domain-containing protein [Tamaricihabitans halophyticus]TCP46816.1 hypothetical protein EV191_11393 [Tamaricihabitans halophyticus]